MRPGRARTPSERSIVRLALYAGFGLVFALWTGSSYDMLRQVEDARTRTTRVQEWFSTTELLLDDVRTGVLEGGIELRNAVLDTTATSDEQYRKRLRQSEQDVRAALASYQSHAHSPAERDDLEDLRRTVEEFWAAGESILMLDEAGLAPAAIRAMREQMAPRRESIRRISDRIRRLNDSAEADLRSAILSENTTTKRRVLLVGGLSLLLSFGVAMFVTRQASRLERQLRRETEKNAESVRALERLSERLVQAQETERRRIARELHDDVGQTLTALKIELSRQAGARPEFARNLDEARQIADQTLKNVRALSRILHPMVLEELGLVAALEWYLGEFSKRTGVETDLAHSGLGERLAPTLETSIYRIVQEATTNVARHAAASSCRVSVQHDHDNVTLIVDDNGRGCDPCTAGDEHAPRGLGLVSIKERVAGAGGTMRFTSAPGKGANLVVTLPTGVTASQV